MNINGVLSFTSVMKSVGGVLLAVAILLIMVTVHEFGHYVAGKILGFKINEFSVGFGPAILKKRSKKTGELFALRIVPLGGYCAFDGEDEYGDETEKTEEPPFEEMENGATVSETNESEYPEPQGERFNDQPPWKRIIVLIAGATMNYILAVFIIIMMFACVGRPVYKVQVENPAPTENGQEMTLSEDFKTGDVILKLNGKHVYLITDYIDAFNGKKQGEKIEAVVLRDGVTQTISATLTADADCVNMSDTHTLLEAMGIYGLYTVKQQHGFFATIGHSFAYSVKIGGTVLRSLGELLTGKLGLEAMGGPVTTIKVTSQAASSGLLSFLNIAAFIGVNLAVFNLLPIPALDGCKVIFCIIEWIRKKPVNRKVETIIHLVGILFLFGFAILVDILQFL